MVWCTVNIEEQYKCLNFSAAIRDDAYLFRFEPYYHVSCRQVHSIDLFLIMNSFGVLIKNMLQTSNKKDCMTLLDQEIADITSLDAGDVFLGGRYHSLLPILQEVYPGK